MKHCKKIISSILAISFVVIFSSEIVAKNPKYGGEVVWGIAAEPTSLAPFGILLGAAHIGKQLGYDSLVEYDRNSNIQPALATHWENPDQDSTFAKRKNTGRMIPSGRDLRPRSWQRP